MSEYEAVVVASGVGRKTVTHLVEYGQSKTACGVRVGGEAITPYNFGAITLEQAEQYVNCKRCEKKMDALRDR